MHSVVAVIYRSFQQRFLRVGMGLGLGLLVAIGLQASPVRVVDDLGQSVDVVPASDSLRIISLAPNVTEILYELGMGPYIVGNTVHCNYPFAARDVAKIGDLRSVNLELLRLLNPSVVIATADGNSKRSVDDIRKLGIATFTINPTNLDGIYSAIERIGALLDHGDNAAMVVNQLRMAYDVVSEQVEGRSNRPRVAMVLGIDPIVVVSRGSYISDLIRRAGGVNVVGTPTRYPKVSLEQLVALKADRIIISDPYARTERLEAFRDQLIALGLPGVEIISNEAILRPGPRVVESIATIAEVLR